MEHYSGSLAVRMHCPLMDLKPVRRENGAALDTRSRSKHKTAVGNSVRIGGRIIFRLLTQQLTLMDLQTPGSQPDPRVPFHLRW
jgi:hypothetical protein